MRDYYEEILVTIRMYVSEEHNEDPDVVFIASAGLLLAIGGTSSEALDNLNLEILENYEQVTGVIKSCT
jgi:hypothetical protein